MDIEPCSIRHEPCPHLCVLVIGGVVLDQNRSTATIVPFQEVKKPQIAFGIENTILRVVKCRAIDLHGTQNLDAFAFSGYGDFGRASDRAPRRMEC
jgi:hypothetical protein